VQWAIFPPPHRYELQTWAEHAEWLVWFIEERAAWLNVRLNSDNPFGFEDVPMHAWHFDAVEFAFINNLMNGISDTLFEPDATLNRAMVTTILWRLAGEPEAQWRPVFTDIAETSPDWYRTAVLWAEAEGLLPWADEQFNPYRVITREEVAAVFYRYADRVLGDDTAVPADFTLEQFHDLDQISSWAEPYFRWANYKGFLQGTSAVALSPSETLTRAQYATILMRFAQDITAQGGVITPWNAW